MRGLDIKQKKYNRMLGGSRCLLLISFVLCFLPVLASAERVPSVSVCNYTVEEYRASCQNFDILVSPAGNVYVANNTGLLCYNGNSWSLASVSNDQPIQRISYLDHRIYAQVGKHLFIGDEKKGEVLSLQLADSLASSLPRDVSFNALSVPLPFTLPEEVRAAIPTAIQTNGSSYWVGTRTNGLFIFDKKGQRLHHLYVGNGLQDNQVHAIALQDENHFWLALDNGIACVTLDSPVCLLAKRSLIGKVNAAFARHDTIYARTNLGQFAYALKAKKLLRLTSPIAFATDTNRKNKKLYDWFSSLHPSGDFEQAEHIYPVNDDQCWLTKGNEAAFFDTHDGEAELKCRLLFSNYRMRMVDRGDAIFSVTDDLHLFSTMQGLVLVDLRKLFRDKVFTSPGGKVVFTHATYIDAEGVEQTLILSDNEVNLPHDFRNLLLDMHTQVFTPHRQMSYFVEGLSSEWSTWSSLGQLHIMQLKEGTYTIRVKKYSLDGHFPVSTLQLKVHPAWYNSVYAYVFYVLFLFGGVKWGLSYMLRQLRKEEEEKNKETCLEKERNLQQARTELLEAELTNKKNELTRQTTALLSRNRTFKALLDELDQQKELLGDRFPNKYYKKLRKKIVESMNNQEDWIQFESYFNSAHQNFMDRLQEKYPSITSGDLRTCCLLRMNLSTKEMASLLNVSVRAVELRRYRLRKKLNLAGTVNLNDFLRTY